MDKLMLTLRGRVALALRRFVSPSSMVRPEHTRGAIPPAKEAYKSLVDIAIPSIIEMLFVSLIGSVDVIMVGMLGFEAIAAVGIAGQPRMIVLAIFFAMNVGVTAIVARRKGQERREDANLTLRNSLSLIVGITAIVMTLSFIYSRQIMLFAGAQPDTVDMADDYFRILNYFLPVSTLTMCINAAQRGSGNTRTPMIANLVANLVNVFFNYVLMFGKMGFPRLEVAGVAWASGIGLCVGLVISAAGLFGRKAIGSFLHISFRDDWRLKKETVKSIFKIGGNAALEQAAQRIGFFIYAVIIANLGTAAFAAHQIAMQFLSFSFNFGNGIAVAGTSLVGQMLGKDRPDLATVYGKASQRLGMVISVILAASIVVFRTPLVSIFLDTNMPDNLETLRIAADLMLMVALFQPPQITAVVVSGCLRGAGDNLFVAIVFIICVAVVRPLFSFLAVNVFGLGIMGAWAASCIDICLRMILVYRRFSGSSWHDKRV